MSARRRYFGAAEGEHGMTKWEPITQLEKLVIRALCVGTSQGPVKEALLPVVRNYSWRRPLHQIIFDALLSIPSDNPMTIRQLLPGKLTRMGFPDVEWDEFFQPLSLSKDEILVVVRRMVDNVQPS